MGAVRNSHWEYFPKIEVMPATPCEKIIKSFFQIYGLSRTGYGNRQCPENLDLKINPRKNRLRFVQLLRWLWLQAAKRYLAVPRMQTKGKNKAVASFCLGRFQKSIEKSPTAGRFTWQTVTGFWASMKDSFSYVASIKSI